MDLSFIFPCLNEEETLKHCIEQVQCALDLDADLHYEIIVADNGSTDKSVEIAESCDATVTHIQAKGYGAALTGGIMAAKGQYVMFADADGSYRLNDALELYRKTANADMDMGIASRMKGKIEDGAMPFLHRYFGTPILTSLINVFFSGKLSDCNSGFRCIKKSAFESWNIRGQGMEFASELLIKALKNKSSIVEISSGLNRDLRSRAPHLKTWRDGMRHLLFILSEKPKLMEITGLFILFVASIMQMIALMAGPMMIGKFNLFDYHTHALLLLAGGIGMQLYLLGCYIYVHSTDRPLAVTKNFLNIDEGILLFTLVISFSLSFFVTASLFLIWISNRFGNLNVINSFLVGLHFIFISGFLNIGLLGIHIIKKAK